MANSDRLLAALSGIRIHSQRNVTKGNRIIAHTFGGRAGGKAVIAGSLAQLSDGNRIPASGSCLTAEGNSCIMSDRVRAYRDRNGSIGGRGIAGGDCAVRNRS